MGKWSIYLLSSEINTHVHVIDSNNINICIFLKFSVFHYYWIADHSCDFGCYAASRRWILRINSGLNVPYRFHWLFQQLVRNKLCKEQKVPRAFQYLVKRMKGHVFFFAILINDQAKDLVIERYLVSFIIL